MSIRLPDDVAEDLEFVARVKGIPLAEAIRDAASLYVATQRADVDFQALLQERIEADQEVVKRFKRGDDE